MNIEINDVCVVGGGTSGWMTASYLLTRNPNLNIKLIESKNIGTIGVGEGTQQYILSFFHDMGIDPHDVLRAVDGTMKLSVRFKNFVNERHPGIQYPFGHYDYPLSDVKEWLYFESMRPEVKPLRDKVLSGGVRLCENNLLGDCGEFELVQDFAMHFDSGLVAEYLKKICLSKERFTYVVDDITEVDRNEDGSVKRLICMINDPIKADLYVDCSGFKSLLINPMTEFRSAKDRLKVDRAWACRIPYTNKHREMAPFTDCVGLKYGWSWLIPLYSKLGCGYVFSSDYIDDDSALEEFKAYIDSDQINLVENPNRSKDLKFRLVEFRSGNQEKSWVQNVCAIGLASGFVEPLEANGLVTTHELIKYLSNHLLRNTITEFDRNIFNRDSVNLMDGWIRFINSHYLVSKRTDTDFWKFYTNTSNPMIDGPYASHFSDYMEGDTQTKRIEGIVHIMMGGDFPVTTTWKSGGQAYGTAFKMLDNYYKFESLEKHKYKNAYKWLKDNIHETV